MIEASTADPATQSTRHAQNAAHAAPAPDQESAMNAGNPAPRTEFLVDCVPLATGETLRLVDPHAVYVHVAQGDVWITEEGAADDIVLAESEGFRLTRRGTAIVEAMTPTVVLLTSPRESGFARAMATSERPPRPARQRHRRGAAGDALAGLRGRYPAWLLALAAPSRRSA